MTLTDTYSATDLQYIIPEVWSPKVEREFQANLLAADFFTDLSDMLVGGGDTINITEIFTNQLSANTKSNASQVTLQSPATAQLTLSVDTWKEASRLIEDKELVQMLQAARMPQEIASQAGYVIAKALDTSLMSLYSGLSQTESDTASDVTDTIVRKAIESLVDSDVDMQDAAFFFHPTVIWHDLMAESKYYDYATFGGKDGVLYTGNFGGEKGKKAFRGRLYSVPVFETTQVQEDGNSTGYFNLLATPKAFAFATQTPGGGRIRTQANYWPESLGMLWTTDIIYGVSELRDDCGVVLKSRQTGTVS